MTTTKTLRKRKSLENRKCFETGPPKLNNLSMAARFRVFPPGVDDMEPFASPMWNGHDVPVPDGLLGLPTSTFFSDGQGHEYVGQSVVATTADDKNHDTKPRKGSHRALSASSFKQRASRGATKKRNTNKLVETIVRPVRAGKRAGSRVPAKVTPLRVYKQKPAMRPPPFQDTKECGEREPALVGPTVDFQISNSEAVDDYMIVKCTQFQQQGCKVWVKALIKGICPKKQSKFPYHRGMPPPWWPPIELCPFREPDHVNKDQRVNLLAHLIRLRPSPELLQEWNGNSDELNESHCLQGWTAFMRELTPLTLFKDLAKEPLDKVNRRPKILEQIFRVAQLEEDYLNGDIDADTVATWSPEMGSSKTRPRRKQRSQAPSVSSDDARHALIALPPSPSASEDKPYERAREHVEDTKEVRVGPSTDMVPYSAGMAAMNIGANAFKPLPPLDAYVGSDSSSSQTSSYVNTPDTASFESSISGYQRRCEPCAGPSTFPNRHDWAYSDHGPTDQQQPVPVFQMANFSQGRIVPTLLLMNDPTQFDLTCLSQPRCGEAFRVQGDAYPYGFDYGYPSMWRDGEGANVAVDLHHMGAFAAHDMQLVGHEQPYQPGGGRSERLQGGEMPTPFQHHQPQTHVPSVHSPPHIVRGFTGHAGGVGGGAWT